MAGDNKPTPQINVITSKKKIADNTKQADELKKSPETDNKAGSALKSQDTKDDSQSAQKEVNGFENKPEPTRFGDWEIGGRCFDF